MGDPWGGAQMSAERVSRAEPGRDHRGAPRAGGAVPGPERVLLHAVRVTKRFGGLVAVRDVDMEIPKGSIVSIIGPNGAGKTTFFNVVAGIIDPTSGSVEFRDRVLIARPSRAWLEPFLWVLPSVIVVLVGSRLAHVRARP